MNRMIFLILMTVTIVSCKSVRTRNLTDQIVLDDIKASSDTVDFYIKQIELYNVERLKAYDFWGEDYPGFNLYITIANKLNESIYLIPTNRYNDFFIGIIPAELKFIGGDTIVFVNSFDEFPRLLSPKASIDFIVSNFGNIDERLFDINQLDNTEPMLDLVRQMKFYYAPLSTNQKNIGHDTIVIDRSHRLRTDTNTKITSWSRIR